MKKHQQKGKISKGKLLQIFVLTLSFSLLLSSCKKEKVEEVVQKEQIAQDWLPSFNEGRAKASIVKFVSEVTDSASSKFVKPEDRIACFDNDGTLWVEQPLPSQLFFELKRIEDMAADYPEWKNEMPFKAIIEKDTAAMGKFGMHDFLKIIGTANAVSNVDDFDDIVNQWLQTAQHPVKKRPYTELVYQPMLELIDYLKVNDFKIYIVSGGSMEFMRAWAPEAYGIPKENIIGSSFKRETKQEGDKIVVSQTGEFEFNDDHFGKVISIDKFIGKKPILIGGNSDGDLEMMEYATTDNPLPTLMLYVDHTDGEREFRYTDQTPMGRLYKGREVANRKGWTLINMKTDWKTVYPN